MTTAVSDLSEFEIKERPYNRMARSINALVVGFCWGAASLTILSLALIFGFLLYKGFSSLSLDFFIKLPGTPGTRIGMANGITGTFVLICMSSLVGVPAGMLCGIYLAEYARDNWFSHTVRTVVDVLAGVPSIVVGVLGYSVLVVKWPQLGMGVEGEAVNVIVWVYNNIAMFRETQFPSGFSAWAGALALAFMMCPIIARTTEEMLRLVPQAYREASVGVGASRFQTLVRVVLPSARGGIITGVMLAVARVAGETAPLLFTVLGSGQPVVLYQSAFPWVKLDLDQAFPALTLQIFNYAQSPFLEWQNLAWAGMLVLITIVLVLNVAVRWVSRDKMSR